MEDTIRVGVSSCLLGNKVRYDGGHKHDYYITDALSRYFSFVPVCPEVECGLPVPREAMRLVGNIENPRLITIKTGIDLTEKMLRYSAARVKELENDDIDAFIFKKNSPSSGLYRVKIYDQSGRVHGKGQGLFARSLVEQFPYLPVEEEGRLQDMSLRENFIERIFSYKRWKNFLIDSPDFRKLITFHAHHKLQLMAHSPKHLSKIGKLVAEGKNIPVQILFKQYGENLMEAMSLKATVKKNVNVLHHIIGYFKKHIGSDDKKELLKLIDQYHNGYSPLVVPLTLINHYIRKHRIIYLSDQTYLEPHPSELMLRNHV
ncbi:MAG: DUF523 and DUF1722 domain-containing protein [Bacillota bacterium]|nr:DUF523 and DUF1722 domain-containing protein [Bacillota bacterium]